MTRYAAAAEATTDLEVVCLCEGEWRLCDARIPATDSRRLISYVEKSKDGYEVLWLPTLSVQHVSSLDEAMSKAREYCARRRASEAELLPS
ncbi:hypothetical protein [Agreia sp. VKM Ac-1783]|uniref:hypothetical protein n=1 Tax=Agreia sp. VKM Ac-1783 TaxID=1938889 RepID=UPI000A2AD734|nr:hypothetical protein [Agreia sp. VKM Ac-1783]SMQ73722.1 hypothetical protein SAMN06295943_2972 [Agreia sp. VKM Ac-1783]